MICPRFISNRNLLLLFTCLLCLKSTAGTDTLLVRKLLKEAKEIQWDDKNTAFNKVYQARIMVAQSPFDKIRADVYQRLGDLHQVYNTPDSCLYYGKKALAIYRRIKDYKGMANCYNMFGSNCYNTGDYTQGLKNYLEALKISMDIGDSIMVAGLYNNIGNIYDSQSDKKRALEYYRKAEKANLRSGKKSWLGINYNNIGLLLEDEKKHAEALEYLKKSYALQRELKDDYQVALAVTNMANCYGQLHQRDSSYKYYRMGWAIYRRLQVPEGIARCKVNLARMFMEDKRLDSALIMAKQALADAEKIHSANVREFAHQYLADIYSKQGDFKNAFIQHRAYVELKDSIAGTQRIAETAQQETVFKFRQDQQEDSLKHVQEKFEQALVNAQKEEKQRYIRYSLLGVILLLSAFGVYVFINFKRKTKLSEALKVQKEIVEEKNKEITQSITYAKRIQHSLLPEEKFLDQYFQSSFVMFRPKDIVSGDFYWFREKAGYVQVVLADCTGHGVPGAMMAVMGNTFLQEAADETRPDEPHRLLEVLDKKVSMALRAKDSTTSDGMDCMVISFHLSSNTAYIASAKRPLIMVSGTDVTEIVGSKFSIGGSDYLNKTFTLVTTKIKKDDLFYLFTDGITDQFGGEKGKKLKYINFRNLVAKNLHLDLKQQHLHLAQTFDYWKGNYEQTDDVCVIGIKV